MNAEIKEKWLAMLKSGEYTKGMSVLKKMIGDSEYTHCCLGVLCELHMKETGDGQWDDRLSYVTKTGKRDRAYLPDEVAQWAEIDHTGRMIISTEDKHNDPNLANLQGGIGLATINDIMEGKTGHDTTFNTVIKYIEKYF